jgi:hypothetical protein
LDPAAPRFSEDSFHGLGLLPNSQLSLFVRQPIQTAGVEVNFQNHPLLRNQLHIIQRRRFAFVRRAFDADHVSPPQRDSGDGTECGRSAIQLRRRQLIASNPFINELIRDKNAGGGSV